MAWRLGLRSLWLHRAGGLLTAAGAEVAVSTRPLTRSFRRHGGLLIGGGFPRYTPGNWPPTADAAGGGQSAAGGAPVVAECAGLLYLARTLDGQPMCGVLPADASMTPRLTLGYRAATADRPVITRAGDQVRAHEFHRTSVSRKLASQRPGGCLAEPGGRGAGALLASYLHLHWAGQPAFAARFAAACAAFRVGPAAGPPQRAWPGPGARREAADRGGGRARRPGADHGQGDPGAAGRGPGAGAGARPARRGGPGGDRAGRGDRAGARGRRGDQAGGVRAERHRRGHAGPPRPRGTPPRTR